MRESGISKIGSTDLRNQKMTMRLLFVTKTPVYGGADKHLVDFIQRLDSPAIDSTLLCYGSDVFSPHVGSQPNVRVLRSEAGLSVDFWSYWRTFRKLTPHTIVFNNSWLGLFPWYAYLAARLSASRGVFLIEHSTGDPAPPAVSGIGLLSALRRCWGWRARFIWRLRLPGILNDKTICVSNSIRERLIGDYGYSESKTVVILNGVDLRRYALSSNAPQKANGKTSPDLSGEILLCIANLTRVKRIDVLLEAVRMVVKGRPSCRCIIVGGGQLEGLLRAQSIELGLAGVVQFVGHIEDVRPYLELADLFLLSSENEGLPLVLGEAMAYGIPCIATDVGGNKEIVSHGQTGLLVKPGSPEQLAEAIEYLLTHPEERCRMGSNALRRVHEHFNIEDSMRRLKRVLLGETLSDLGNPAN